MPTMLLPVELTDREKVNVLGEMSGVITEIELAKMAKTAAMAAHNKTIAGHEAKLHSINESIKSSTVDRPVEIEVEKFPLSGKAKIWRLDRDPKEFVKEIDLDPAEAQLLIKGAVLDGAGGTVTNLADHQTEEQALAGTPEEAEELRAQRLANEREERIGALAAELTEKVMVVQIPTAAGEPEQFVGTLVTGEPPEQLTYERTLGSADEARAVVARLAAEHITGMADEAAAAAAAPVALPAPDPIDAVMASLRDRIVLEEKPDGKLMARIDGEIEGLPGRQGFSGPIRATAQETIDEMLAQVQQLLEDGRVWLQTMDASKQKEIDQLAADQAADEAATKRRLLKVPAGAKSRRKPKPDDGDEKPVETTAAPAPAVSSDPPVDTTPPDGVTF